MQFTYDDYGSLLKAGSDTFTVDASTLRMTARNGAAFGYDNNGNLRTGPFGTFTYTRRNQIATATVGSASTS